MPPCFHWSAKRNEHWASQRFPSPISNIKHFISPHQHQLQLFYQSTRISWLWSWTAFSREFGEEEELGEPLVRPEEDPAQGKVDVAVRVVAIESPCIIPPSFSEHPELGLDHEEVVVVELDLLVRRVDKVLLDVAQRRLLLVVPKRASSHRNYQQKTKKVADQLIRADRLQLGHQPIGLVHQRLAAAGRDGAHLEVIQKVLGVFDEEVDALKLQVLLVTGQCCWDDGVGCCWKVEGLVTVWLLMRLLLKNRSRRRCRSADEHRLRSSACHVDGGGGGDCGKTDDNH
ncbi:hypothetical protein TYRP_020547 [Tyrophagus putrescentiae]|nr:hypothetical protein TYRP_020547 [Tyrophagus putrescentiae]